MQRDGAEPPHHASSGRLAVRMIRPPSIRSTARASHALNVAIG